MRTSDVDILILPGWTGSGPDHWQTRWERKLPTARRIAQDDWDRPVLDAWVARLIEAVERTERPPVLVAHSLGVNTIAAAADLINGKVIGGYLVAPVATPDEELRREADPAFFDLSMQALGFPSVLVASATDPNCPLDRAKELAGVWGSELAEAGDSGHINTASGHGPWPDGLLRFGKFLAALGPAPYAKP